VTSASHAGPALAVLVVDDDEIVRNGLVAFFATLGMLVRCAASADEAREITAHDAPDLVLLDLRLPGGGVTLLEALREDDPQVGVIMMSGRADAVSTAQALQRGALDVIEKPLELDALQASVMRVAEVVRLRREVVVLREHYHTDDGDGTLSPSLEKLVEVAARNDDVPVLIVGEAGTGKTLLARHIHDASSRRAELFVPLYGDFRGSDLPEQGLFGRERGTATSATRSQRGLLEVAARGTVFIADVDRLPAAVQAKLLDVLENGRFMRVGGSATLQSGARVIAASRRRSSDPAGFRSDLHLPLQLLTLSIPPLRERRSDLPGLVQGLLPRSARLDHEAARAIDEYSWPGNVRELRDVLWRAALLAGGRPISVQHLLLPRAMGDRKWRDALSLADAERRAITRAMRTTRGNKVQAAELLGIARSTLQEKLRRIEPPANDER